MTSSHEARREGEKNTSFRGRVKSRVESIINSDGKPVHFFKIAMEKGDGTTGGREVFLHCEITPDLIRQIKPGRNVVVLGDEHSKRRPRKAKGQRAVWRIAAEKNQFPK